MERKLQNYKLRSVDSYLSSSIIHCPTNEGYRNGARVGLKFVK